MAYSAMAKVVTVLCVAFLVAHVESARLLQHYDDAGVTAETFPSQQVPVAEAFAELHAEGPVAEYNYNLPADDSTPIPEEASTDEGLHATDFFLVGETTADSSPAKVSYVFDAEHGDEPVFTPEDNNTPDFVTLADSQGGVEPVDDSTSLAVDTRDFEFQEFPSKEVSQGDRPGFFAFDDTLASP